MIECLLSLCLAKADPIAQTFEAGAVQTLEFTQNEDSITCLDSYGHRFPKGQMGFESCVSNSSQPVLLKSNSAQEAVHDSGSY